VTFRVQIFLYVLRRGETGIALMLDPLVLRLAAFRQNRLKRGPSDRAPPMSQRGIRPLFNFNANFNTLLSPTLHGYPKIP